jgi:glycosyltransferase involved in cell wall biosynthesis
MLVDISVIIPTFRRPKQLAEALSSALSQSGFSLEVIVLDDSPDGSAQSVVEKLKDPRIQFAKRDNPTGGRPARVRNQGWRRATGEFVHFLDDDDRVIAGAYSKLVKALRDHPKVGVAFGVVKPFGNNPQVLAEQTAYFKNAAFRARWAHRIGSRRLMVANMLFKPTVLVNSACLLRRSCIEPLGGYDEDLTVFEDVDFHLRAIRRFGCVFVDAPVLEYRTGAPSIMHDMQGRERGNTAYKQIQRHYRQDHGAAEFVLMKVLSRTVLRPL